MERTEIILMLAGFYTAKTDSGEDLIIAIDQHLTNSNQPCMTKDELTLLTRCYEEAWGIFKTLGMNRKDFRKMGKIS